MCGIAGIVSTQFGPADADFLKRMTAALIHRGPDDEGYYWGRHVGLGQRRLSIIDLSTGHQPLSNEDGSVWVVFNGEIYNFQELREELEKTGHRFTTVSDTEVIVHAYEQYGPECLHRFRGMFAIALWDDRTHTLFLARDRVGKKPLYYTQAGGQFLFASELQALVQHPAVRRDIDPAAVDDYLTYGYIPGPKTIFHHVFKLPPAHYLVLRPCDDGSEAGRIRSERYWQLAYSPKVALGEKEAGQALLAILTDAVRLRMIADVPLGALLSGGIDSGLVVALMSRLSGQRVKTFSIGFDESEFNELSYARMVAQQYGTEHHELIVRPDALEVLPTLVRHYGEPFADSSAIPTYYVAKLTRQHVTVALNGDGGDESFAGYERYLGNNWADSYRKVPALLRKGVIEPLSRLIPDSLPRRNRLRQVKRFLVNAAEPLGKRYPRWVSYLTPQQKHDLYTAEFREELGGHDGSDWLANLLDTAASSGLSSLDTVLSVDVESYLSNDLLVKMDIATMANSLEARSPLLDHKVMEFAARLPASYKLRGITLKYLLRQLGKDLLPPEILERRKMGFGVPVGAWMRHEIRPLLEDTLLSPQARTRRYFQTEAMRRFVEAHVSGQKDYSYPLWSIFWLEMWHRQFMP